MGRPAKRGRLNWAALKASEPGMLWRMGKITAVAPPVVAVVDRGGECPECEHDAGAPSAQPWFVRLFRMRPLPASCGVRVFDASGFAEPCGCAAHFHGS